MRIDSVCAALCKAKNLSGFLNNKSISFTLLRFYFCFKYSYVGFYVSIIHLTIISNKSFQFCIPRFSLIAPMKKKPMIARMRYV